MNSQRDATIAYFTVIQDDRTGWTGGLLLLNGRGRPLEFQCTLPVRPSRAHSILFGPTLRDHLIGDVIAPLLVQKCRTPISLLCCDQPEALRIGPSQNFPVVLVDQAAEEDEGPITDETMTGTATAALGTATLRFDASHVDTMAEIIPSFADLPDAVEPFERIREAIKEAHSQIARAQPDPIRDNEAA